jgi:pilus assembly protein CpaC
MRSRIAHRLVALAGALALLAGGGEVRAQTGQEPADEAAAAQAPAALVPFPSLVSLERGEIRSLPVNQVSRVALGDPAVVDLTIVSTSEILLQARAPGMTNLIVWDGAGRHAAAVQVVDRQPEVVEAELRRLLEGLHLSSNIDVKREGEKIFLTGNAERAEDVDQLEEALTAFQGVTNLVRVTPPPLPPKDRPPPSVKLSVQLVEINVSELEHLGVKWSSGFTLTEPEATDLTYENALLRWGTSLTRSSISQTLTALIQKNKARILSEPKLVTASGKEASSFIGIEIPIITTTSETVAGTGSTTSGTNIEFRQTGVTLRMTPTVWPEDENGEEKITMIIDTEVSDLDESVALSVPVGSQTVSVPGFKVRQATTEVTTVSGETIMIAGLLESEDSKVVNQVPGLGSMPVIGRLFRSPENESAQRELVVTVTPELLGESDRTAEKIMAVEQALAIAEVTPAAENPTVRYAVQVQDRIAQAIHYPPQAKEMGTSGLVKLRLRLLRDGTLGNVTITQSSGVDSLDHETLNAAQSQSPYPPFPPEITQQELILELPIHFRS